MKGIITGIITGIKANWDATPNSVKFWNGLVLVGLIISGIFSLDLLFAEWGIMSILAFALAIDGMNDDGKSMENHIWIYFTPFSWVLLLFGLIIIGCIGLYDGVIVRFNNWLNKK